jgi:hypothetical protein
MARPRCTRLRRRQPFYKASTRLAGVRLVAHDIDWNPGQGPEARGAATESCSSQLAAKPT